MAEPATEPHTRHRNWHPADELASVRAEIKTLQLREGTLRSELLTGDDLSGVDFSAQVRVSRREGLDVAAVKRHFGMAALKPFVTVTEVRQVWLSAKRATDKTTDKTFSIENRSTDNTTDKTPLS